jgi:hypothetical protein
MAVKLLVPWWTYQPGHVVELGEAFDEKMIAKGKGEKVAKEPPKVIVPERAKEKRHER